VGGGEGVLDALGDAPAGRHRVPVLPGPVPHRLDLVPARHRRLHHSLRSAGLLRRDPGAVLDVLAQLSRSRAAFAALRSISKSVPSRLIRTVSTSSVEPSRSSTRNVRVTVAMSIKVPEWRSRACGQVRVSDASFRQPVC